MFDDLIYSVCFIIVKTVYLNFLKLFCLVVAVASLFPKFIIAKRLPQWHNDRSKNLTKILLKSSCHGSRPFQILLGNFLATFRILSNFFVREQLQATFRNTSTFLVTYGLF